MVVGVLPGYNNVHERAMYSNTPGGFKGGLRRGFKGGLRRGVSEFSKEAVPSQAPFEAS